MDFFKINADEYQVIDMLSRYHRRRTNGSRKQKKVYGESMIVNALIRREPLDNIPESFLVLVIKNGNAGSGNYGGYYRTVDIFTASKETMQETKCFMRFRDRRVKKENVLALVF